MDKRLDQAPHRFSQDEVPRRPGRVPRAAAGIGSDVSPGPHPTDIHSPASDLSDEELAYHREQLAAALRGLRGDNTLRGVKSG